MRLVYYSLSSLLIFSSFFSCNNKIKKFQPTLKEISSLKYSPYFNKEIKPLKKDWKELYYYLKKGHILKHKEELSYIYSYELYTLLNKNRLKIYEIPYLQDYDNFIKVFGEPRSKLENDTIIIIAYLQNVIGGSCETCNYSSFGCNFDSKTKKLKSNF